MMRVRWRRKEFDSVEVLYTCLRRSEALVDRALRLGTRRRG
jgi:hypothetical protein